MKVRHCRAGDPEWGRVCACGEPKSLQAWKCQRCRTLDKRTTGLTRAEYNRAFWWRRMGLAPSVGTLAPLYERLDALERARIAVTDSDLTRLIEQQRTDDTHRVWSWTVSLDTADCFGRPLYELIAA